MQPARAVVVAGEASGDLLGAGVLAALRTALPGMTAAGIGGPRMVGEGFDAWVAAERLAVFGYADALARLPELLRIRKALRERVLRERTDVFVGIDAPDFNFALEAAVKAAGVPTVHVVCPSIWAWRPERVHSLARAADLVLCLFPFEPELLARHGVAARFIGHPLADAIPLEPPRDAARAALGLAAEDTVAAVLPGSRHSEVALLAPPFLKAAARLLRERPGLKLVSPIAPGRRAQLEALIAQHTPGLPIRLLDGQAHTVLAAADVAWVASGTATLEAALFKLPSVIAYRVSALNWWLMRRRALQPWFGLPNILAGEFIMPERIQDAATPERLAADAAAWLNDAGARERLRARCLHIHQSLRQGAAERAAQAIASLVE